MVGNKDNFLISVIMPIYNVDSYLKESLESVVSQDINFFKNIEIILVDDGSTDNSSNICKKYTNTFPNNVRYIYQENCGVSNARNVGLSLARGDYIHFFDGDDIISKDFYSKSIDFLEKHKNVDFVASKLMFFDAAIDSHPLNGKFDQTRIIDIFIEPDFPLLHVISCVFRRESLTGQSFDERLAIAEDVKLISDVLIKKGRYGVLSDTVYHYRKRTDASSAIGGKESKKYYYLDVPKYSYQYILRSWQENKKKSSWAEYTVLYDIAYRLKQKAQFILSTDEEEHYKKLIQTILSMCSDEAIVSNSYLSVYQKVYALKCKYGNDISKHITSGNAANFDDLVLYNHENTEVHVDFLHRMNETVYKVEGYIKGPVKQLGAETFLQVADQKYPLKFVSRVQREESFLGDVYNDGNAFEIDFDFGIDSTLRFCMRVSEKSEHTLKLHTGPFTGFGALKLTYRRDENRLIKRTTSELSSNVYSRTRHLKLELRMLVQILLNWRLSTARAQLRKLKTRNLVHLNAKAKLFEIVKPTLFMLEAVYYIPRGILLRMAYYVAAYYKKRPIWIISDRGMSAGDNGEAFFRYLMKQNIKNIDIYFAISKQSKDYERIINIGPTLKHSSLHHKLMHLLADKIISSQADVETTNPFIRQFDHYADLMKFEFIFLQHGVIRHDLSDWLNRFNKNINLFVTTAKKEYDSILSNPYYYKPNNVIMSGLPRYDLLESYPQNKIILAPTYRKNLVRMKTDKNGARNYDSLFKNSEYRNFYNRLINDERLQNIMKRHNVTGEFYIHPVFSAQRADFDGSDTFKIMEFPYDYRQAFKEGSLMISDHSSVVFDFAYLRKPVLYAHFDIKTFFQGHTYNESNFFSDTDDGFGEVCMDYDSLIEATINSIDNNFTLSDKYRKRIDDFFAFKDTCNSKRLYDVIIDKSMRGVDE